MSEDEEMPSIKEEEDSDKAMEEDTQTKPSEEQGAAYLPGQPLEEGEELVCDQSAYEMFHQAKTSSPCLSFDIIPDSLGENRQTHPHTAYLVCGTQAPQAHINHIIVMKLSNLHKTQKSNEEDDESDDEEEEPDDNKSPKMHGALIKHQGCVNRIRCTNLNGKMLAASWSELGRVNIFDLMEQRKVIENDLTLANYNKEGKANKCTPIFSFAGHQKEGFGLHWCQTEPGVLASGDCNRDIHIWHPTATEWSVDQRPLVGHTASVEDIQWSPNERNVLASCSVDKTIRIWDTRAPGTKACMLTADGAHQSDVNVISWNHNEPFIVSGGDDGFLHIWDLRRFQDKTPLATFKHHTEPVTTVEWHPTDPAVFASGGSDNQIALWDLSVERDEENDPQEVQELPPQLLFIHQGQTDIKELHWHPQIPGVIISTAASGFNIFRTISV